MKTITDILNMELPEALHECFLNLSYVMDKNEDDFSEEQYSNLEDALATLESVQAEVEVSRDRRIEVVQQDCGDYMRQQHHTLHTGAGGVL